MFIVEALVNIVGFLIGAAVLSVFMTLIVLSMAALATPPRNPGPKRYNPYMKYGVRPQGMRQAATQQAQPVPTPTKQPGTTPTKQPGATPTKNSSGGAPTGQPITK